MFSSFTENSTTYIVECHDYSSIYRSQNYKSTYVHHVTISFNFLLSSHTFILRLHPMCLCLQKKERARWFFFFWKRTALVTYRGKTKFVVVVTFFSLLSFFRVHIYKHWWGNKILAIAFSLCFCIRWPLIRTSEEEQIDLIVYGHIAVTSSVDNFLFSDLKMHIINVKPINRAA
jgi:hypothetical protein